MPNITNYNSETRLPRTNNPITAPVATRFTVAAPPVKVGEGTLLVVAGATADSVVGETGATLLLVLVSMVVGATGATLLVVMVVLAAAG